MEFSDYSCRVILGFFGLKSNILKFTFKFTALIIKMMMMMIIIIIIIVDSHVIHAIFYWDVKSPSNFTTKQHFII